MNTHALFTFLVDDADRPARVASNRYALALRHRYAIRSAAGRLARIAHLVVELSRGRPVRCVDARFPLIRFDAAGHPAADAEHAALSAALASDPWLALPLPRPAYPPVLVQRPRRDDGRWKPAGQLATALMCEVFGDLDHALAAAA